MSKVDQLSESPLRIKAEVAAKLTGVGESTWWRRHSAGETPSACVFGGTTRWIRTEIIAWIESGCPSRKQWKQIWAKRHDVA